MIEDDILNWSIKTFENETFSQKLQKWNEELKEVRDARGESRLFEIADLFIVAIGMRRFNKEVSKKMVDYVNSLFPSNKNLMEYVSIKMEQNKKRVFELNGSVYRHKTKGKMKIKNGTRVLYSVNRERREGTVARNCDGYVFIIQDSYKRPLVRKETDVVVLD